MQRRLFKLAEYQIGSHILMVKNDAYYEADKVKLARYPRHHGQR